MRASRPRRCRKRGQGRPRRTCAGAGAAARTSKRAARLCLPPPAGVTGDWRVIRGETPGRSPPAFGGWERVGAGAMPVEENKHVHAPGVDLRCAPPTRDPSWPISVPLPRTDFGRSVRGPGAAAGGRAARVPAAAELDHLMDAARHLRTPRAPRVRGAAKREAQHLRPTPRAPLGSTADFCRRVRNAIRVSGCLRCAGQARTPRLRGAPRSPARPRGVLRGPGP